MYSQITANKRRSIILIIIFIALAAGVGWAFSLYTDFGYGALVFALIFSFGTALFGYYKGDAVALASSGAKKIKKEDNPYVYRMVENLCITAGMQVPKVHIIDDSAINAFATGRDPKHASIAVTTGAIQKLENEELEGVIAHELSHIKNYDIRLMTLVIILVGVIALLADWFLRIQFWGGGRRSSNREGGQAQAIFMIIGLALIILSPIIAQLIKFAVSRKREFLADASGVMLTRYPEGLARALEKIGKDSARLKRRNHATAHLFISSPFKPKGKSKGRIRKLFSTHPPVEERVATLRGMA